MMARVSNSMQASAAAPDYVAGALLQTLEWPAGRTGAWGALRSVVVGLLTLGLWPLLVWMARFREVVSVESDQLRELAEWLRVHSLAPQTGRLVWLAQKVRVRPGLLAVSLLAVFGVAALFVVRLADARVHRPEQVVDAVLGATWHHGSASARAGLSGGDARMLFAWWTIGMSVAYGAHWVNVWRHGRAVRQYVRCANELFGWHDLPPVRTRDIGGRGPWAVGAVVMFFVGFYWGVPLMMAGGAHRRYVEGMGGPLKRELAQRVRALVVARGPRALAGAGPVCPRSGCRKKLPARAAFCPRCGMAVGG